MTFPSAYAKVNGENIDFLLACLPLIDVFCFLNHNVLNIVFCFLIIYMADISTLCIYMAEIYALDQSVQAFAQFLGT